MMRGGHLDSACSARSRSRWRAISPTGTPGAKGAIPAVGGAMDLAIGAKSVYVMMEHQTKKGESKIVPQCSYPVTGSPASRASTPTWR
jgi:3-oxoadipate CoA-transferase beta subunit